MRIDSRPHQSHSRSSFSPPMRTLHHLASSNLVGRSHMRILFIIVPKRFEFYFRANQY